MQSIFISIWINIASYDSSKGRLYTWLLNVTRNKTIDFMRSKATRFRKNWVEVSNDFHTQVAPIKVVDMGLRKVINQLPPKDRKLIELGYYKGYTQCQLAEIMDMPLGTVKTRMRAVIKVLRKILNAENLVIN